MRTKLCYFLLRGESTDLYTQAEKSADKTQSGIRNIHCVTLKNRWIGVAKTESSQRALGVGFRRYPESGEVLEFLLRLIWVGSAAFDLLANYAPK